MDVFCEAFEADLAKPEKFYQNYAILKWRHGDLTSTPENASALVFVVEEIRNNRTEWRILTQVILRFLVYICYFIFVYHWQPYKVYVFH